MLVTAFGGVGAVSRAPIGIIRTMPETRALLQQCVEEVAAVARARGIQLDDTVVTDTMRYVDSLAVTATTSLQRDIAGGKAKRQSAAARIAGTRQDGVSAMSYAQICFFMLVAI